LVSGRLLSGVVLIIDYERFGWTGILLPTNTTIIRRFPTRYGLQMFGGERCAKFEFSKLSVRKRRWVMSLIDEFLKVPELQKSIENLGHDEVILRILDDTSANREGGKLYSSIESALSYWKRNYGRNGE